MVVIHIDSGIKIPLCIIYIILYVLSAYKSTIHDIDWLHVKAQSCSTRNTHRLVQG